MQHYIPAQCVLPPHFVPLFTLSRGGRLNLGGFLPTTARAMNVAVDLAYEHLYLHMWRGAL